MKETKNKVKSFFKGDDTKQQSKTTKNLLILLVLVVLELTVFNFRFYQNMFNQPFSINETQFNTFGLVSQGNGVNRVTDSEAFVEAYNLNKHIKNVYINLDIPDVLKEDRNNHAISVGISATDQGNSDYFDTPNRVIATDLNRSKYIPLSLNGDSAKIKLKIFDFKDKDIIVNDIVFNAKMPFSFNVFRIIFLFAVISLVRLLRVKNGSYTKMFKGDSRNQKIIMTIAIVINVFVFICLGVINPEYKATTSHDTPPASLIMLDNPYDPDMRRTAVNNNGESFKWDTAYRNGRYYVYFGIVPCLMYYLPLKAMGIELSNKYFIMAVVSIIIIFGYLLLYEINRRWFKNISFLAHLMLSIIFVNSTGIILATRAMDLYHVPIMAAMMFLIMTMYFWIKALPEKEKGTLKGKYLTIGSITMALVAGCRPQLLLMAFISVPLFWDYVFKQRTLFSKTSVRKTVGFMLPFVIFGAFMMFYNYARFGSVFDFGQNYNLTVMDMTAEHFNIEKIPLGLFTYFLQLPGTSVIFPYIHYAGTYTQFMGNYVREEVTGGMFIHHIILFFLIMTTKVKDLLKEKKLLWIVCMLLGISLIVCMLDFNTGGIVERYRTDFTWQIFLAAIIVIYAVLEKYNNTPFYVLILTVLSVCFMWSFVNDFAELFNATYKTYSLTCPAFFYNMQYIIEFWL